MHCPTCATRWLDWQVHPARNDVLINIAIIMMALITAWTTSGWPDLILGCFIILLALHAAHEVWEVSEEERLASKALAGEAID